MLNTFAPVWLPRHPLQDFLSVTDWNSVPVKLAPSRSPSPGPGPTVRFLSLWM